MVDGEAWIVKREPWMVTQPEPIVFLTSDN